MKRRTALAALLVLGYLDCAPRAQPVDAPAIAPAAEPRRMRVVDSMQRATQFMVEQASCEGGYVWNLLPDRSRRWGEMEANATMIWVQPPGTASVGDVLLDAYRATADEYYYEAAARAAEALARGQHESGGWNYLIDFAGESSLRQWYDTIGKNAWRLEEFQHYYGNATFDDGGTIESARFLLRLYLEKRDARYQPPLERALAFVLDSQLENGCWPQRYPMTEKHRQAGLPWFPALSTFNDDVASGNIEFLLSYWSALGDERLVAAAERAMGCFLALQLPSPQAGWSEQYDERQAPAAARSYEPRALSTKRTARNVEQLLLFYRLTGDARYLERVPDALDWLDSVRLPKSSPPAEHTHPSHVALGSNEPLYVHRSGSNVVNGRYHADGDPSHPIAHSMQTRAIDVAGLRRRLAALRALSVAEATQGSPLLAARESEVGKPPSSRAWHRADADSALGASLSDAAIDELIGELSLEGYWPSELAATSHPFAGPGDAAVTPGDFSETFVGDRYDTSPYPPDEPLIGISTETYLRNMRILMAYLDASPP